MNSRSSVNETNLVNFSAELSTLNQLDAKDGLLSFPFDHIYACHSQSSERRQPLQLEKEIEVSTHCVAPEEKLTTTSADVTRLSEQLAISENRNKKLKDLLIYHLDLIQQQNELITKRDKLYHALKQENDTLKGKLMRMERKFESKERTLESILGPPTSTVTSGILRDEQGASHIMLNSFTELLLPDKGNSLLFDNNKPFGQGTFGIARTIIEPETPTYASGDVTVPAYDTTSNTDQNTMIDNKRSVVKKDAKTEGRQEALYKVTSNSGAPIIQRIQRNRRKPSGLGSLSRMSRAPKKQPTETVTSSKSKASTDTGYDRSYSVNKKSKTLNTYGKSKNAAASKQPTQYTGSLSDRLRLIDTTPTGEDPYQLGEADMREQSPIPKLMLQKTNHGRMKIREAGQTSQRLYDSDKTDKFSRFMSNYDRSKNNKEKTVIIDEPDLEMVKTEAEIDWRLLPPERPVNDESLCDFGFEDETNNLSSMLPSLDANEFQELFTSEAALNLDGLNHTTLDYPTEKMDMAVEIKRGAPSTRGRKRAFSATGVGKQPKAPAKPRAPRGRAAARGKASPVPGLVTKKPYSTLVGDPDVTWYLGLDPDIKHDDVDPPADTQASTVEVPRWREKPYTSCYTLEGTENVDDRVFEKRHQKLEAEERRQLRWHMRRIREQRHVERLRLRHRDSWSSTVSAPSVYSVWPRPQDAKFIEITTELPVTAFGEPLPQLPQADFMLPWVRLSKALKRAKRSKTLH